MSHISGPSPAVVSLRGYVSRFASPDDPWPETYFIVSVSPDAWRATFSLHELMNVLHGDGAGGLRGIPWRWQGDELVVSFGPVRVRGTAGEWLALARRVVDSAGSAEDLLEAPGPSPWSGPTSLVSVDAVDVPGDSKEGPEAATLRTPDSRLAAAGGFSDDEFTELLGVGWRHVETRAEAELFGGQLYLWGDPVQLAAEVDGTGRLRVGLPSGSWSGPGGLEYGIVDAVPVDSGIAQSMVESFVRDLLRRRRRSFSWCRYCGDPLAPEDRLRPDVCYGCGTTVLETVY